MDGWAVLSVPARTLAHLVESVVFEAVDAAMRRSRSKCIAPEKRTLVVHAALVRLRDSLNSTFSASGVTMLYFVNAQCRTSVM